MLLTLRMPIACLCIVLYILYYFRQNRHLATEAATCYNAMSWCVACNLVADVFLEIDRISGKNWFHAGLWNNVMFLTIMTAAFLLYAYMLNGIELGQGKRRYLEKLFFVIAWCVFAALIIVSPFEEVKTKYGIYVRGRMLFVTYAAVAIPAVGMLVHGILHRKWLTAKQYKAFCQSFFIYVGFGAIRFVVPWLHLMGLMQIMILLILVFFMANPERYADESTSLFNERALKRILREKTLSKRPGFSVLVCALNNDDKKKKDVTDHAMTAAAKYMMRHFRMQAYRMTDDILVFVDEGLIRPVAKLNTKEMPNFTEGFEGIRQHELLFRYPADCADYDGVMGKLEEFKLQNAGEEAFMDAMTGVFNRNRYEHDVPQYVKEREKAWLLVVDINNLKITNDKFGHEAGDDLIITVAHLLQDVFSANGCVYRTGGDEFMIVYLGEEEITDKVEQLRAECKRKNTRRSLPVKFAIGYAHYQTGGDSWQEIAKTADANMYEDKIKSKQKP